MLSSLPLFFQNNHNIELIVQSRYLLNIELPELNLLIPHGHSTILTHTVFSVSQKVFILLEQDSRCILSIQDDPVNREHDQQAIEYHILLEQGAHFDLHLSLLSAHNLSVLIYVYLQGSHCQASIKGVYALHENQNLSIKTFQNHIGQNTQSTLVLKGMLKDVARVFYEGLIFIGPDAKKTQASQENKNILLSKQAKVISIPSIEVLQHDVQCSHGSAIGRFEQEQLWYLQSKGLSEAKARELLIRSFFGSVIENFEDKELIEEAVCQKIV